MKNREEEKEITRKRGRKEEEKRKIINEIKIVGKKKNPGEEKKVK